MRTLVFLTLLLGCGAARQSEPVAVAPVEEAPAPVGPVNARGDDAVRARVGAAGGTLSLSNGARLEIPEGALSEEVEIAMSNAPACRAFGDAESQRPLGPVLNVEPPLSTSTGAFELSIPQVALPGGYREDDLAFAVEDVAVGSRASETLATETHWNFLPVVVRNGRFVARTDGLPGHRVQFGVAR
jgi:hypothetical protein